VSERPPEGQWRGWLLIAALVAGFFLLITNPSCGAIHHDGCHGPTDPYTCAYYE
jgi:hypothetical protein